MVLGGPQGIDGQIGAARLQDSEERNHELDRAIQGYRDERLRAQPKLGETVGHRIGHHIQLGETEPAIF